MLKFALDLQHEYEATVSEEYRKGRGQVLTSPEVARFMASLFKEIPNPYTLLDPGAGIGTLSTAFCERLLQLPSPRTLIIHLFEDDDKLAPLIQRNLENCVRVLRKAGHSLKYVIHRDDFIVATSHGLNGQDLFEKNSFVTEFDGVIMNPPYFKLRKDSLHAKLMERIVHGQPNIYAFFMALAAQRLKPQGELVAITPRSFCSGLYFRGFRRWYLDRVSLDHIHIFQSRTEAFRHSNVLQETIISKVHRLGTQSTSIRITSSVGSELNGNTHQSDVPAKDAIDNSSGDRVIRIPEDKDDREIMQLVESFPYRFPETGLRISTGPVVLFRVNPHLLKEKPGVSSAPLLHPHNVKPFAVHWPLGKNGKPSTLQCCEESLRLLIPTKNYVLLKRFSAKEEKRRLTAGCFFGRSVPCPHVGIENHLNYIYHAHRELTEDEVFGIAALCNSALIDRYFRTISGNTQVNATEIRAMKFPGLEVLSEIGRYVRQNTTEAENIVLRELGVANSLLTRLVGSEYEQAR